MRQLCLPATLCLLALLTLSGHAYAEQDSPEPEPFVVRVFFGSGLGTRGFVRPIELGVEQLDESIFPAFEAGLQAQLFPRARFQLEALLRYQTSVGFAVEQRPLFAPSDEIGMRAERVELSLAPVFKLGSAPAAPRLIFPVGCSLRTLWPDERERGVLGYTLLGPMLRGEVEVPLFERVRLRGGPEAQLIVGVDEPVRAHGLASIGLAFGVELLASVSLHERIALELAYRQAYARIAGEGDAHALEDLERFMTLRLKGAL